MGQTCFSIHVNGAPGKTVAQRVAELAHGTSTAAYESQWPGEWTAIYPSVEFIESVPEHELIRALVPKHVLTVRLIDSNDLEYWYAYRAASSSTTSILPRTTSTRPTKTSWRPWEIPGRSIESGERFDEAISMDHLLRVG